MSITVEGEFRYIVNWFSEFSELQREDFVPIFLEILKSDSAHSQINGIISATAAADLSDRPMSLFQCRMKLFREWSPKWTQELKTKLKEKIMEIDEKVGEKIASELKMVNGELSSPIVDVDNAEQSALSNATSAVVVAGAADLVGQEEQQVQGVISDQEPVNSGNSRLATLPECETPVDDDDNADDKQCDGKEDVHIILVNQSEPDQPVSMHQQSIVVAAEISSLAA